MKIMMMTIMVRITFLTRMVKIVRELFFMRTEMMMTMIVVRIDTWLQSSEMSSGASCWESLKPRIQQRENFITLTFMTDRKKKRKKEKKKR